MADIFGGPNDNILSGTSGNDFFDGRGGSDTYLVSANSGWDHYHDTGTSGVDTILATQSDIHIQLAGDFSAANGIEVISAGGYSSVDIFGSPGADNYNFTGITLVGISEIELGNGADHCIGSAGADYICGDNGADTIYGGGGNDTVLGGGSNDLRPGWNYLHALDGNDLLFGGAGNDLMCGGQGNDTLHGGAGADTLYGSIGHDSLFGGQGADTFLFQTAREGGNTIGDFTPGVDVIDLSAIDANHSEIGNQAFTFDGQSNTVQPHSVTYCYSGNDTIVQADINGDHVADFQIVLASHLTLTAGDFIL